MIEVHCRLLSYERALLPTSEMIALQLSCVVLFYSVSTGMPHVHVEFAHVRVHLRCLCLLCANCFSAHVRTACANLPFLELGTTPGLCPILLPAEDDGISEAVSPPKGFPIWGTFYSDFYVSERARTARLWMQGIDIVLQTV